MPGQTNPRRARPKTSPHVLTAPPPEPAPRLSAQTTKQRPKTPTVDGLAAISRLLKLAAEIEERTNERTRLLTYAHQHGCRLTDIATASGLSRSMVARMVGARS